MLADIRLNDRAGDYCSQRAAIQSNSPISGPLTKDNESLFQVHSIRSTNWRLVKHDLSCFGVSDASKHRNTRYAASNAIFLNYTTHTSTQFPSAASR